MKTTYLLISILYVSVKSQLFLTPETNQNVTNCIIKILDKYFSKLKELTYVNMHHDTDELLQNIHLTTKYSVINKEPNQPMHLSNQGYLVHSTDVNIFVNNFEELRRELFWNPYARFLIIIEVLEESELRYVFNTLLRLHINNVIVLNKNQNGHLYSYNPFKNNACGRYYNNIINYGLCSHSKDNLYPNKLINGLKGCTFRASITHRPPYTIDPTQNEYRNKLDGMEQQILNIVSDSDGFKVNYQFDFDGNTMPTVYPNMTANGAMTKLQNNETDILFSAMMMFDTRAAAFSYLTGYHDYVDQLRLAVKKASAVPNWRNCYLEFDFVVWIILLMSFIFYSSVMIFLLPEKDKGEVVLELLDNLLLHGRSICTSMSVKCVLLMWVWFAYLINTFYQSSLVSLTTNPSKEYQISNEKDVIRYGVRPCIGSVLANYMYTKKSERLNFNRTKVKNVACDDVISAVKLVSSNREMFTLIPSYYFMYNKQQFNDKWGDPLIFYFAKPYAKVLLTYYFYKGFPISNRLKMNMMRMRESGLVEKNLKDQYFMRSIKFSFSQKEFEFRFVCPWWLYFTGFFIAIICFVVELLIK